jgi:hypothetical protein
MHILLEFVDSPGNGACYEHVLPGCTSTPNKQRCG